MLQATNCAKCQSTKIIPKARIIDTNDNFKWDLTVEVYEDPDALIFKGAHRENMFARICGECGYVETYVENPQELYSAYQIAQSQL